jgi:hypothetical protein
VPSGTLYMADFPSGANPVRLASSLIGSGSQQGVAAYDLIVTKQGTLAWIALMQAFDGTSGVFKILKSPAASLEDPGNVVKVLAGAPVLPTNAPDLRHGWFFLNRALGMTPTTDSRVLHYDGTPGCTLSVAPTTTLFGAPFSDNSALSFWVDNYNVDSDTGDGMTASPTDCSSKKRRFALNIDYWFPKGDEQLVYTDDVTGTRSTLRVAKIVNGELGPGQVIQRQIDRFFLLLPDQEGVVYRLASGSADDGVYYYKLP